MNTKMLHKVFYMMYGGIDSFGWNINVGFLKISFTSIHKGQVDYFWETFFFLKKLLSNSQTQTDMKMWALFSL